MEMLPEPVQRNLFDVAVDLTKLYYEKVIPNSAKEVQETYLMFYAGALATYRGEIDFKKYLTDE